jgi:hypothetical protein
MQQIMLEKSLSRISHLVEISTALLYVMLKATKFSGMGSKKAHLGVLFCWLYITKKLTYAK